MDIKYAIGQRLMVGLNTTEIDDEFRSFVHKYKLGNVILFKRNIKTRAQLTKLCMDLNTLIMSETATKPLIAIDQEGGVVTRLSDDMINTPGAMALSAAGPNAPYLAGVITGRELERVGINLDFAPVLDVNSNPSNPVIGVRSFGDEPKKVSDLALRYMRGILESGVLACGKHFPGHGDTAVDSHLGLPIVNKTKDELYKCELIPFIDAIKADIPMIMTSHVLFPWLEEERLPATMSKNILTRLLRKELGFNGVIISDCMEMQAIAKFYGTVRGSIASMDAGADIIIISHTLSTARKAADSMYLEFTKGTFDTDDFMASVKRIEKTKSLLVNHETKHTSYDLDASMAYELFSDSFVEVHGALPKLGTNPFFTGCRFLQSSPVSGDTGEIPDFPSFMAANIGGSKLTTSDNPGKDEISRAVCMAENSTCIVLGTLNAYLKSGQISLMKALGELKKPMIVVALRNPYDLQLLPEGAAGIAAWEYSLRSLHALIPFIQGNCKAQGKMPLTYSKF